MKYVILCDANVEEGSNDSGNGDFLCIPQRFVGYI